MNSHGLFSDHLEINDGKVYKFSELKEKPIHII